MGIRKAAFLFALAASVVGFGPTANALTISYSIGDSISSLSGAYTIDFGVSPVNNTDVVSGRFPSGTL